MGTLAADYLLANFNTTGAMIATAIMIVLSLYLVSSFSMSKLASLARRTDGVFRSGLRNRFESWRDIRRQKRMELLPGPRRTGSFARGRKAGEETAAHLDSNRSQFPTRLNLSPSLWPRALHAPNP